VSGSREKRLPDVKQEQKPSGKTGPDCKKKVAAIQRAAKHEFFRSL
jgi:hypothetical protein